ncbi:MAG: LytTR family DNA-binding domain-containing protein [Bacteroidota bacterium]
MQKVGVALSTIKQHKFLRYAYLFLGVAFILMMIQNAIRYGSYDHYSPLRSFFYLFNSMLLFFPLLPLSLYLAKRYLTKKKSLYIISGLIFIPLLITGFYVCSSACLYTFGYYEEIFSSQYARNYFSREALLHIIVLVGIWIYAQSQKASVAKRTLIQGSLGRKKMQVPQASIHWIEADDHYLRLFRKGDMLIKRSSMKEMEQQLAPDFLRIHRKYLVNRSEIEGHMKEKQGHYLILRSGHQLKIGGSYLHILVTLGFHDK